MQYIARQLVRMASAELIGQKLLDLEGQIPAEQGLSCQNFELWHAWRRAVKRAESAAELLPQVRTPFAPVFTTHGRPLIEVQKL